MYEALIYIGYLYFPAAGVQLGVSVNHCLTLSALHSPCACRAIQNKPQLLEYCGIQRLYYRLPLLPFTKPLWRVFISCLAQFLG